MRTALPTALLVMFVAFAACGPKQPPEGPRKQNEISALWTQIRDWRREAGLDVEPRPSDVNSVAPMTVKQVQQVCPDNHPVPATCSDVCSLADAICDNAEQICILAGELGKQDTWAQDKCSSAKASCREAKRKCCGKCSESKPEPAAAPAKPATTTTKPATTATAGSATPTKVRAP
ncbi:MAG TPA: hypothetical protein VLB44_04480 [Kofleriaceae bacterium]|nr:hypothetical protein [Kofleriaceae bacterium]